MSFSVGWSRSVGWSQVFGMRGRVELPMPAPLVPLLVLLFVAIPAAAWG